VTSRAAAGLVIIAAALAACASIMPPPDSGVSITEMDLEPRIVDGPPGGPPPNGPVVEVARGTVDGASYRMTVYRQGEGLCIDTAWSSGESLGCGAPPGDAVTGHEVFGMTGFSGADDAAHDVSGVVRSDVDAVVINTARNGQVQAVMVPLDAADIDAAAFFAFLPPGVDTEALVALGADGEILESFTPLRPAGP